MTLRSEEHTSELQSLAYLVCRPLLEKKKYVDKEPDIGQTQRQNWSKAIRPGVQASFGTDSGTLRDLHSFPTRRSSDLLQNAASIASLLLTTEAVISQRPSDEKTGAAVHGGGGMY